MTEAHDVRKERVTRARATRRRERIAQLLADIVGACEPRTAIVLDRARSSLHGAVLGVAERAVVLRLLGEHRARQEVTVVARGAAGLIGHRVAVLLARTERREVHIETSTERAIGGGATDGRAITGARAELDAHIARCTGRSSGTGRRGGKRTRRRAAHRGAVTREVTRGPCLTAREIERITRDRRGVERIDETVEGLRIDLLRKSHASAPTECESKDESSHEISMT